jgi:chromosome segregation ATPase
VEHQQQREERYASLERMAATLQGRVTQLENTVEQQSIENVQVEASLRGRITELEEELAERERRCECKELHMRLKKAHFEKIIVFNWVDAIENVVREQECEWGNLEAYHNCVINELCAKLRESDRNKKEEEAALYEQINELNKKLKDTNSDKKDMEYALRCKMKKLVALAVSVSVAAAAVVAWVLL